MGAIAFGAGVVFMYCAPRLWAFLIGRRAYEAEPPEPSFDPLTKLYAIITEEANKVVAALKDNTAMASQLHGVIVGLDKRITALSGSSVSSETYIDKSQRQLLALDAIREGITQLAQAQRQFVRGMYGGEIPWQEPEDAIDGPLRAKAASVARRYGISMEEAMQHVRSTDVYRQSGDGMREGV